MENAEDSEDIIEIEEDVEIEEDDIAEIDVEDNAVVTFSHHADSVLCCNLDYNGVFAVSGGQDDKAFVWNVASGETKFQCPGHQESVIAAKFNFDSTLVATADMNGLIQVWDVESGAKVWEYEVSEVTWLLWDSSSNALYAGTLDNCWKWCVLDAENCSIFPTHGCGSTCGVLFFNGSRLAVGYQDGSIKIWNTENQSLVGSLTGKEAHSENVTCMTCSKDDNLILSGSEDGTAKLIRTSNSKVLKTWKLSSIEQEEKESIESVCFFKSHPLVSIGTNCGKLKIFDLSTHNLRVEADVDEVIVKIICCESSPHLFIASSVDIFLYDGRTAEKLRTWSGHTQQIMDFVISKDEKTIITASDDQTCKIFKV